MKALFISLALSLVSFAAKADVVTGTTLYNCTVSLSGSGSIVGYNFDIIQEEKTNVLKAVVAPNCPVCMVVPLVIDLPATGSIGTRDFYGGGGLFIDIALESPVPTKSHSALIYWQSKDPYSGTCVAP